MSLGLGYDAMRVVIRREAVQLGSDGDALQLGSDAMRCRWDPMRCSAVGIRGDAVQLDSEAMLCSWDLTRRSADMYPT